MSELQREHEVYKRALPTLLGSEGKFVLVIGDEIVGTFDAYPDALQAGYDRAGLSPFLVKKISGAETIAFFTRDLGAPCLA